MPLKHVTITTALLIFFVQAIAQLSPTNNILYVDKQVAGGDHSGSSWENAVTELADALQYARAINNYTAASPLQIYVAKGIYKPLYNAGSNNFTSGTDRNNAFVLVRHVQLYGGFDPEHQIKAPDDGRIFGPDGSVLSGDINNNDAVSGSGGTLYITGNEENNYHVVIAAGDMGSAVLNGFTLTGANADTRGQIVVNGWSVNTSNGGGMYNIGAAPALVHVTFSGNTASGKGGGMLSLTSSSPSPTLMQCRFINNMGGGMYNTYSSPTLTHCSFTGNWAADNGGGMENDNASPKLMYCSFTGNSANSGGGMYNFNDSRPAPVLIDCSFTANSVSSAGGGMYNHFSSPTLTNCSFTSNAANFGGGGMWTQGSSSPAITGCSFTNNWAPLGGGMCNYNNPSATITNTTIANNGSGFYAYSGSFVFQNCIVWDPISGGSYTFRYSLIKGASATGNGNLDATLYTENDIFTNYSGGNYTLKPTSPAVNKGSNTLFAGLDANTRDLAGNPRLSGAAIDLGAYEYDPSWVLPVLFGRLTAVIKDRQLLVNWRTETETNNDHFLVQVSQDGIRWKTVQTIQSNARHGNSDVPVEYNHAIPLTSLSLGAGLLLLGALVPGRRKYGFMAAAIILSAVAFACNKKDLSRLNANENLLVRIVQVDKDGTEQVSKVVKVTGE
ncbi:right-handed parallel beta-helix repeat-containing protein [Niabella sp.]|uniref:right-handed parallel beta-helix repeat-containing protein n=1 Tax=Niabella sp. TaxID=1962976 RepID=UPI00262B06B0|nr:right-handed parallel beta-helix repeat-containing protein [Niabella sp.]